MLTLRAPLLHTVPRIITPPLLIYNTTFAAFGGRDEDVARYLVNASLIASGICTIIQVARVPLGKKYQLGTGLLSVMGTSFTWLPLAQEAISLQGGSGKTWNQAYGAILGTLALLSITEMLIAFVPYKVMRRIVPPLVSGVAVALIGIGLIGSGFRNWGGGAFCGDNFRGILPPRQISTDCYVANATVPEGFSSVGTCFAPTIVPKCFPGNGEVALNFGHGAYLGMGLSVAGFMVIIELFGSPFMRNANVILGLLFG
jgi:uric acid-xanthine permease